MKPFNIDLETVEGAALRGDLIEIQGAMTVRPESQPLDGVHQSSVFMSLANAAKLQSWLQAMLVESLRRDAAKSPTKG